MADLQTVRQNASGLVRKGRAWAEGLLVWKIWQRLLESEFVDRSVALAGKAFVSFFPLVIVVAAYAPPGVRASIFSTLTHRLGLVGGSLALAKHAFASADDVRRATGILGLVLTFFYATGFTTALQRVYLRAWRRPPIKSVHSYGVGLTWTAAVIAYMAGLGALRAILGGHLGLIVMAVFATAGTAAFWWFTTWLMLGGQVRWRAVLPSGLISGVIMTVYAFSATIWMPNTLASNERQFGFFGVALALVTWFSGAATCVMVGACAGAVLAEDQGGTGRLIRGPVAAILVEGAQPSLPPPVRALTLASAFESADEEDSPGPGGRAS